MLKVSQKESTPCCYEYSFSGPDFPHCNREQQSKDGNRNACTRTHLYLISEAILLRIFRKYQACSNCQPLLVSDGRLLHYWTLFLSLTVPCERREMCLFLVYFVFHWVRQRTSVSRAAKLMSSLSGIHSSSEWALFKGSAHPSTLTNRLATFIRTKFTFLESNGNLPGNLTGTPACQWGPSGTVLQRGTDITCKLYFAS